MMKSEVLILLSSIEKMSSNNDMQRNKNDFKCMNKWYKAGGTMTYECELRNRDNRFPLASGGNSARICKLTKLSGETPPGKA